jgi:superfamily I DNA/RNA helicase
MQLCLKRASGWRGAGCCWGTWMTSDDMRVSKGLEFPVVERSGVGHMPAKGEDEQEAAGVFYVAAMRATQRLVLGVGKDRGLREG